MSSKVAPDDTSSSDGADSPPATSSPNSSSLPEPTPMSLDQPPLSLPCLNPDPAAPAPPLPAAEFVTLLRSTTSVREHMTFDDLLLGVYASGFEPGLEEMKAIRDEIAAARGERVAALVAGLFEKYLVPVDELRRNLHHFRQHHWVPRADDYQLICASDYLRGRIVNIFLPFVSIFGMDRFFPRTTPTEVEIHQLTK